MEMSRDARGFPSGDGAGGRTPHSTDQLTMTSDTIQVGETTRKYIKLYDKDREKWRPAVVCYPPGSATSYAVVHTAEDYTRKLKCMTQRRFESFIEPKMKEWDAPAAVHRLVRMAAEGRFDGVVDMGEYQSVISYVMYLVEQDNPYQAADRVQAEVMSYG